MLRDWISRMRGDALELLREKRREPRAAYEHKLSLNSNGEKIEAVCLEASASGLRIETSARSPLKAGDTVVLVNRDGSNSVGRVAWTRTLPRTGRMIAGMALPSSPLPAPSRAERRCYVRLPLRVEAHLKFRDTRYVGQTQDASLRGLRLTLRERVPAGTTCLLQLPAAGLELEAQVLDCRGSRAEQTVRLSIPTMKPRQQAAWGAYLKNHL